jgi:predicted metalloprotease with PDZ domain
MVFGQDTALAMLEREEARGFRLIDRFYRLFGRYLEARDRYPDLESFYPAILDDLACLRIEEGSAPGSMGFYPRFEESGVVVLRLVEGSAFERAGIEPGDRITAIAGEPVGPEAAFDAAKARHWEGAREGETVSVTVSREGRTLNFEIPVPFGTRLEYVEGGREEIG